MTAARPAFWPVWCLAMMALACGGAPPLAQTAVLLNGSMHDHEWDDAAVVTEQSDVELRVRRGGEWLYVLIILNGPRHGGVDLYLASDKTVRMLHVSSALGQRRLADGSWSQMSWGENRLWSANTVGMIIADGKATPVPPSAFEFQVHRSLLPGANWRIRVHLKDPEVIVPPDTTANSPEDWLIVP